VPCVIVTNDPGLHSPRGGEQARGRLREDFASNDPSTGCRLTLGEFIIRFMNP